MFTIKLYYRYCIEKYIKHNLSPSERSAMVQFRFGTWKLGGPVLDERLCTTCQFNEIEDE